MCSFLFHKIIPEGKGCKTYKMLKWCMLRTVKVSFSFELQDAYHFSKMTTKSRLCHMKTKYFFVISLLVIFLNLCILYL